MMARVRRVLRGAGDALVLVLAVAMIGLFVSAIPAFLGLAGVLAEPTTSALAGALTRFVLALVCLFIIAGIGKVTQ